MNDEETHSASTVNTTSVMLRYVKEHKRKSMLTACARQGQYKWERKTLYIYYCLTYILDRMQSKSPG